MSAVWIPVLLAVAAVAVGGLVYFMKRRPRRPEVEASPDLAAARESFHRRREWLEAKFLTLASQSGKPRGLEWLSCEFDDQVAFARDRTSGDLRALVAVTIRFEAIAGGGMEHVEAVSNLRAATAVFTNQAGEWTTSGRAIFNLNPVEAIRFYHNELQGVE